MITEVYGFDVNPDVNGLKENEYYCYDILCYNKKTGFIFQEGKTFILGGIKDSKIYQNQIIKKTILNDNTVEIDDICIRISKI